MNKFITGVSASKDEARDHIRSSKDNFKQYLRHMEDKKHEYRQLKQSNEKMRHQLIEEKKLAERTKFRPMQKKHYFLPALHEKDFFRTQKTHNIDTEYLDGREIERLTMPDKRFLTN